MSMYRSVHRPRHSAWSPVMPGRRIVVIGTSGAGKTTLTRRLARVLGYAQIELDALHWEPDWTPADPDVFRGRVDAATVQEAWVSDGNYGTVRDLSWGRADTIIWLDYSLPCVMWRVTTRTMRRSLRGEVLWNGNRESLRKAFFERESILLWALTTYRDRRRRYAAVFASDEYADRTLLRFRSPGDAERWLRAVAVEVRRSR